MNLIGLVFAFAGLLIAGSWAGDCVITGQGTTTDPGTKATTTAKETTSTTEATTTTKTKTADNTANQGKRRRRDTDVCSAYASTPTDGDKDCSKLKTYIGCTFRVDSEHPCDVPKADRELIVKRNCSGDVGGVCKCEIDYYKSDLSTNKCTALKALESCLNKAKNDEGCGEEKKADVQTFLTGRKTTACESGGNIVYAAPGLLLALLLAAVYL